MTRRQIIRAFEIIDDVRRVIIDKNRAGAVTWVRAPLQQVLEALRYRGIEEFHIETTP